MASSPCDTVASTPVLYWNCFDSLRSSTLRSTLTPTSTAVTAARYRPHELWSGSESIIGAPRASLASMRIRERLRDPARVTRRSPAARLPGSVSAEELRERGARS